MAAKDEHKADQTRHPDVSTAARRELEFFRREPLTWWRAHRTVSGMTNHATGERLDPVVSGPFPDFQHRVDQAIGRNILVAPKPVDQVP